MKPHETFLELAAAAIDFPLPAADRSRLDQHLAGCVACARSVGGLLEDALALESLRPIALPERRGAEILGAALHPRSVGKPMRLVAVAALLALLLIGTLIAGSELRKRGDGDLVVVPPVPNETAAPHTTAAPDATPTVSNPPPSSAAGTLAVTLGDPAEGSWVEVVTLGTGEERPLGFGADPAWGPDGLLVYACAKDVGANTTICVVDLNSSNGIQPEIASDAAHPVPAPDGSLVAVHRGTIDVGETWLMDPDGSNARRLAAGAFLRWSPDGRLLLGQPESATYRVAIIGVDGTGLTVIADPGFDPAWSPSGQRVVFVAQDGDTSVLRQADIVEGWTEDLYVAPAGAALTDPAYLPDEGWVFVLDGDLWRLRSGTGQPELLRLTTGLAIPADAADEAIDVSPDGRSIAFTSGTGTEARVGVAAVDGSGWELLDMGNLVAGPVTQPRWAPAAASVAPLGTVWVDAVVPVTIGHGVGRMEAVTAGPPFVAVGVGRASGPPEYVEGVVWTSADGRTWVRVPASDATNLGTVTPMSGPTARMFDVTGGFTGWVAIGYAARPSMEASAWFSPDGEEWTRVRIGPADRVRVSAVAWTGRRYVAVGEDRPALPDAAAIGSATARAGVWTSDDGLTWTQVPATDAFDAGGFIDTMEDPVGGGMSDVVAGPGGVVAVGTVCQSSPAACQAAAWVSPDGLTWERASVPSTSGRLASVAASGSTYVAVGTDACGGESCPGLVMTSTDGRTWARQPFEQPGDLQGVTVVGAQFLATSQYGPEPVWSSVDGSSWVPAPMQGGPSAAALTDPCFAADRSTAVWLAMIGDEPDAWVSQGTRP